MKALYELIGRDYYYEFGIGRKRGDKTVKLEIFAENFKEVSKKADKLLEDAGEIWKFEITNISEIKNSADEKIEEVETNELI